MAHYPSKGSPSKARSYISKCAMDPKVGRLKRWLCLDVLGVTDARRGRPAAYRRQESRGEGRGEGRGRPGRGGGA